MKSVYVRVCARAHLEEKLLYTTAHRLFVLYKYKDFTDATLEICIVAYRHLVYGTDHSAMNVYIIGS